MGSVITMVSPRGRQMTRDGRERFRMYPNKGTGLRYVYALGYSNGRTKIGVCNRPRSRFIQHWIASEGLITWTHLFGSFPSARALSIEREACARAAVVGQRIRRTESFLNLDRAQALSCVRTAIRDKA